MERICVIDSHTGGEPTRTVMSGLPDLGGGTVAEQLQIFRERFDHYRSAIINEPRGSDVLVGALLVPSANTSCVTGVIFFNNVGMLGMCGHGTIGLVATLAHTGRIAPGSHRIETNVGIVTATLHPDGSVSVENIPSYRTVSGVSAEGVTGDIAWSGNWFYLCADHGLQISLANVEALTNLSWRVRQYLNANGYPDLDHVEFFGPPHDPKNHSRNFVLCPGKAYDRSPCGTGTSAKLACLAADGKLAPGEPWIQESLIGSTFVGTYRPGEGLSIIPTITGTAFITAEATLLVDPRDPLRWGIQPENGFSGSIKAPTLRQPHD